MMKMYKKITDLPKDMPVFPLSGGMLLPRTDMPLNIFEPRYVEMFEDAMAGDRIIGMVQPRHDDGGKKPKLTDVGCAGRITSYTETPDGRLLITLTGIMRFKVKKELKSEKPYRQITVDYKGFAADLLQGFGAADVNRSGLLKAFRDYLEANNMTTNWDEIEQVSNEMLVNSLSLMAPYPSQEKQALLEAVDLKERAEMLIALTEVAISKQGRGKNRNLQ